MDDYAKRLQKIQTEILRLSKDPDLLNSLGTMAVDIIYKRVKGGYGVSDDQSDSPTQQRLLSLSPAYVNQRKKLNLGEFGSVKRSNLTLTGQMLSSMSYKILNDKVQISIPPTSRSDGKLNSDIASYVRQARPFLSLTKGEQRILTTELKNNLRQKLNDIF